MKIIKKIINDILVTYIKTDKFKSVAGTIYFKSPVKKEKMTSRLLLKELMFNSCKKYNTSEKIELNCLENYDAYYGAFLSRYGNYLVNSFTFECINDKFIKDDVIDPVTDTFLEILLRPNIKDDKFNEDDFSLCYEKLKASIQREKENVRNYCYSKLLSKMDEANPYSYKKNIKDLESLDSRNMYDEYLDLINNSSIELFLVGDFDYEKIADKITSNFKSVDYKEEKFIENKLNKKKLEIYKEKAATSGSVIFVGMKCINLTNYERLVVMPLYSGILGGGASSRCFDIIREKNSLAYYCYTKYEKDDAILLMYAGIEDKNFEKTKDLMISLQEGMNNINEEELEITKKEIISTMKSLEDYETRLLDLNYYREFYGEKKLSRQIKLINNVSIEDILKVHEKIYKDCVYFINGNEEYTNEED